MTGDGCALVTGGSRGIGAACARALAADGWTIGVNYRSDAAAAEAVVAEVAAAGGTALALHGDVAEPGVAEELFGTLEQRHGPVRVLVNNAGIAHDALAVQLPDEEWQRVLATNLSGAFWTTRRALRSMIRARFGRIVNVTSVSGIRGVPGQANYGAAKAGLIGLTKTVAREVARRGVTVNAIAPGLIDTDMTRDIVQNGATDAIPARRAGSPGEVAACVRFLASPEAGYVTGAVLVVDGGMTA